MEAGIFMPAYDVVKMFLNFMLESAICSYAGVDLSNLFPDEENGKLTAY